MLDRPRQNAFAKFGDLLAVFQHDCVFADEIDTADVGVQIDPDARPIEPRGHLFDVSRLAGPVIALDQDAPVMREARQNGERGFAIENIGCIQIGNVLIRLGERRHCHRHVQAKGVAHIDHHVGRGGGIKTIRWHSSSVHI
jgi:hypothetical protein